MKKRAFTLRNFNVSQNLLSLEVEDYRFLENVYLISMISIEPAFLSANCILQCDRITSSFINNMLL